MTRFTPQWLQAGSYTGGADRRLIGALWPTAAVTGCAVTATGAMNLQVAAGQVAVPTANNTGSLLCTSDAAEVVTLDAAPAAGSNRIDVVICQARGNDVDGGVNNDFVFTFVKGTAAASPVAPAVPANAVALASVYLAGGSAAVVAGNVTDLRAFRPLSALGGPRDALHARVYQAGAWNSATGSPVAMGYDSSDYDPAALWNAPGRNFRAPTAGIYLIQSLTSVTFISGTLGETLLTRNGTAITASANGYNGPYGRARVFASTAIRCAAGDLLASAFFTGPAACTGNSGPTETWCAVDYLGTG